MDEFTLEDSLAELAAEYALPERERGEYDITQLAGAMGKSDRYAWTLMRAKVARGEWTERTVRGAHGRALTVWRKAA